MYQKQYKDLTDQEVFQITALLLHTAKSEKDIAEEFNTSSRAVRRIAGVLRIDSEKREKAIIPKKRYVWHFQEGGRVRFWVEDQNLKDIGKCPACGDDQRPCKCGLL